MATIWTGSLVATGSAGVLATAKTVYLNTDFVYNLSETEYINNSGAATAGRLVQYKAGAGPDMVSLIFSTALAAIRTSMNTQPTNKNTLNAYTLTVIPQDGSPNYTITVNTADIWWVEDADTNQAYVTVYDNSKTAPVTYKVSITGGAPAVQTAINN
jgi:hypothetical protein